jgi:hypothetical protein
VIVLALCIPLGMLNLDDNIGFQIGGMLLTVVCVCVWFADFTTRGTLAIAHMPAFPPNSNAYPTLLSTVIFNYGFVATIPSWLNEKAPRVNVPSTVWWSVLLATVQFLLVSVPAALAIPSLPGSCNLLSVINRHFDDRAKIVAARAVKSAINAALDQIRELAINNSDVKGEKLRFLIMASEEVAKVDQRFLADHVNVTSFDPW